MSSANEYLQQAIDFCTNNNAQITCVYSRTTKYFDDDKEERDIYSVKIQTPKGVMIFDFGQSTANKGGWTCKDIFNNGNGGYSENKKYSYNGLFLFATKQDAYAKTHSFKVNEKKRVSPTEYDILSCLTKYHPGNFVDFCSEFGYDTDSKRAEKTYYAVLKEYADLSSIFTHQQLEEMREIS